MDTGQQDKYNIIPKLFLDFDTIRGVEIGYDWMLILTL